MNKSLSIYKTAILNGQHFYAQAIREGEGPADEVQAEHATLFRLAEEGCQIPDIQDATVDYIYTILGAVERWGEWSLWTELLQQLAQQLPKINAPYLKTIYWLSHFYYLNRNFEDALSVLLEAQDIAIHIAAPKLLGQVQQRLANVYLAMGKLSEAENVMQDALLLCKELEEAWALVAALWNTAGLVWLQQGKPDQAIEAFNKALALWEKQQVKIPLSRCELNMGVAYFQQGHYEQAADHFNRARAYMEKLSSPVDMLRVINNLASSYYMQGKYGQGEKILIEAISKSRQLVGIYHIRGSLNHNLGNILLAQKRYGEAEVYLQNSLQLWDLANDLLERANSLDTLGELYQTQQQFRKALNAYQEAYQLIQQYPDHVAAQHLAAQCVKEIKKCEALLQKKESSASTN